MRYWITSDTHFGHDKLKEYTERPDRFENIILHKHSSLIRDDDVLIHLGDFCIGKETYWHDKFMTRIKCKKWLVKGNHDKKSNTWYMSHGWDFVADSIGLRVFGLKIALSHIPMIDNGLFDVNVHGHFHNSDHRRHEPELVAIKTYKHKLVKLEHAYEPQLLRKIVGA